PAPPDVPPALVAPPLPELAPPWPWPPAPPGFPDPPPELQAAASKTMGATIARSFTFQEVTPGTGCGSRRTLRALPRPLPAPTRPRWWPPPGIRWARPL